MVVAREWPFATTASPQAPPAGVIDALEAWFAHWKQGGSSSAGVWPAVAVRDLVIDSLFVADYPDEPGLIAVRFLIRGSIGERHRQTWKRLYLRYEDGPGWVPVAEGNG